MPTYVIEIDGPHNEPVIFSPLQQRVRGRWDFSRAFHREMSDSLRRVATVASVIPGQAIVLDTDTKVGSIVDLLGETEEGKRVLKSANAVMGDFPHVFGNGEKQPVPTQQHQLNEDGLKTWLWVMRSLVDANQARVAKGTLPTADAIRSMPGRRKRDPGNTGSQVEKLQEWVDEVPLKGKASAGAAS